MANKASSQSENVKNDAQSNTHNTDPENLFKIDNSSNSKKSKRNPSKSSSKSHNQNSTKYNTYFALLLVFHTVIYAVFRYLDQAYQTWDSAGHLGLTMRFADLYKDYLAGGSTTILDIATESNYYPPLVHQFVAVLNVMFGYNFQIQLLFIFVLFLVTLFVIYKMVQEIGFSRAQAFYTAFFFSFFPLVADQARLFHMEIPLTLTLLICFRFLFYSKNFTDFKNVLGFFIVFGLAQLIKWYAFLFLVVPVGYYLYLGLFGDEDPIKLVQSKSLILNSLKRQNLGPIVRNILIGSIVFLVIAVPWYVVNYHELRLLSSLFSVGENDDPQVFLSFTNLLFYLRGFVAYHIYLLPVLASIAGGYLAYKKNKTYVILVLIQVAIVYAVFTIIENKNQRYVFGLSPLFAFFMAYFITQINKRILTMVAVVFTVGAFMFTTFNHVERVTTEARAWGILFAGPYWDGIYNAPDVYSYDTVRPPIDDIYDTILADAEESGIEAVGITPLMDYERISAANMEMVRNQRGLEDVFVPVPYYQFVPFESDYDIVKFLRDKNVSYVIVPEWPGPDGLRNFVALKQASDFMTERGSTWFEPIKEYDIDNDLTIYKIKSWNTGSEINTCETLGENDGNFGITIEPLSSLIMFTGHYQYKDLQTEYEPGTLHILEINNFNEYPMGIDVSSLPVSGFSYCHRLGTKLKIKNEIAEALLENKASCGEVECARVVRTKVNGNDPTQVETEEFDTLYFVGQGAERILKDLRLIPLYESEYKVEEEIFVEYDVERN